MSSVLDSITPAPRRGARRYGRWIAVIGVSLLLHLAALDLLPHWTIDATDDDAAEAPLRATLMPPIEPVVEPVEPSPKPKAAAPSARRVPRKAVEPVFVPDSITEPVPDVRVAAPAPKPAPAPAPEPTVPIANPPAPPPTPPVVAAVAPQSARLSYKVLSTDFRNAEPTHYYGVGAIDWAIADGRYRSDLRAALKILFIEVNVLALHSEGAVIASGLAPDRYTETPRKRAMVATSFNRDARQSITFSASQASVPLVAGVQDRLSLLFQIGALLLAGGQPSIAGTRIEMPVAGIRGEVETWTFESLGIESIEAGPGPLSTTHLRRSPKPGSNDRTIDVWVAQEAGGYPARVLYTEPNGNTIEMTLDTIGAIE